PRSHRGADQRRGGRGRGLRLTHALGPRDAAEGARMSLAVELEDVSFAYGLGRPVLENVNLALGQGEFVAVAGPNGGGKTTLVRIVLGLERPSAGRGPPRGGS